MKTELLCELVRNLVGYFLVTVGVVAIGVGARWQIPELTKTGAALISAGLLAFQARRSVSPADPAASPKV